MNEYDKKAIIRNTISWWNLFRPQDGYDRYKGDRAELRRCHSTKDVMFLPAYHMLIDKCNIDVTDIEYNNGLQELLKSLAVTAWVLSWVSNESEVLFAEMLAKSEPQFHAARFRRLIETSEWDVLGVLLVRALKFTKRTANIPDLVKSIVYWNTGSFIKEQWALRYYRFVKKE